MAVRVSIISTYNNKGMARAQRDMARATKQFSGLGQFAKKAAFGVVAVAAGLTAFAIGAAKGIQAAQAVDKGLASVTASMKIFGDKTDAVVKRVAGFAEEQEKLLGIDADVIKTTQTKLMTFKELAKSAGDVGGNFDRATMAAQDMAAAGFGKAEQNAVSLGKALQDPIKGITSLGRQGVTFTQQEKEKIKTLVESGKASEAQNMILKAIETQVGGTAKATATSSEKMRLGFERMKDAIGAPLLAAFEKIEPTITGVFDKIGDTVGSFSAWLKEGVAPLDALSMAIGENFGAKAADVFDKLIATVRRVIDAFKAIGAWVQSNRGWIEPLVVGVAAMVAAYKTWAFITNVMAVAQAALNIVLNANPIGLVVLAIVGLVAAIAYLWKRNEKFREIVTKTWDAIKAAGVATWEFLKKFLKGAWDAIVAVFKITPVGFVVTHWTQIQDATKRVWNMVKAFLAKAWDVIVAIFKVTPLGFIVTNWTKIIDWIKSVPNKVKTSLGNLKTLLLDAGKNIITGLWDGMKKMWEDAKKWITGIADWIKQHKGPLSADLLLLQPAGQAIMQGLGIGLADGFPAIGRQLAAYTRQIATSAAGGGGTFGGAALAGAGGGGRVLHVEAGAIVIQLPPGTSEQTATRAGASVVAALRRELELA